MKMYSEFLEDAQEEVDRYRLALGPASWPDEDTYWALVSERAAEMQNTQELTTAEAASELGVTDRRVRALIASGRLVARKDRGGYVVRYGDLATVRDRVPGRPPAK